MHFSFVSSLVGIPFDTADNALTIFNCTAGSRYADRKCILICSNFIAVLIALGLAVPVDGVWSTNSAEDHLKTVEFQEISCR